MKDQETSKNKEEPDYQSLAGFILKQNVSRTWTNMEKVRGLSISDSTSDQASGPSSPPAALYVCTASVASWCLWETAGSGTCAQGIHLTWTFQVPQKESLPRFAHHYPSL